VVSSSRFAFLFAGLALLSGVDAARAQDDTRDLYEAYYAVIDGIELPVNAVDHVLAVKANDAYLPDGETAPPAAESPAVLSIVEGPRHGTARVDADPTAVLYYTPGRDYVGGDRLRYRACLDGWCTEADVWLRVGLVPGVDRKGLHAGRTTVALPDAPAAATLRIETTTLLPSKHVPTYAGPDYSHGSPWDHEAFLTPELEAYFGDEWPRLSGTHVVYDTIPAGVPGQDRTYRVLVVGERGGRRYLGVDEDGDGAEEEETRCAALPVCDMTVVQSGDQPVRFWVMAHDGGAMNHTEWNEVFVIPVDSAEDGELVVTGPGHLASGQDTTLDVAWHDPTLVGGPLAWGRERSMHAGFARLFDGDTLLGDFRVTVEMERLTADDVPLRAATRLVSGRTTSIVLDRIEQHRSMFIDVPPGATRLRAILRSPIDVDLYLVPYLREIDPASTEIAPVPGLSAARATSLGPTGEEAAEVAGTALTPGRWHVVARNRTGEVAPVDVSVEIEASAPVVRSGSYFNPARPGTGLFLYPAGDQLTGLLYAYDVDGLPTWYYLQAPQPGTTGLWTSRLWRATWDGDSRILGPVGEATVTATGEDTFQFSYVLDGFAGTQPMEAFGFGCPMHDGAPLDISSTWFDPARPGTGYDVQTWPDYEFFAAYYFDGEGRPRFVTAESDTFAGTGATLVVQQVQGACPTCAHVAPTRTPIGWLTRRLGGGTLQTIATDLEFEAPLSGGWTTLDTVQPLGGPGTTQGCAP
jgi:hypothetical protein